MIGEIKLFNSIGGHEAREVNRAIMAPLSGYLAGQERGGEYVVALEDAWSTTFHVKHSIACNSATSGLLAAAFAVGLKAGDRFACPAMTMSATAAAPMFTGAKPFFVDVEDETFGMSDEQLPNDAPVIVTNLFGHPADLMPLRQHCDANHTVMIEDNSQSPFAWAKNGPLGSLYTGTIGHIGVFSLNVHKPLQCGEGGVIVTEDSHLADRMRAFINHGEHAGRLDVGLNLRMPEVCAAIALSQLRRGEEIVQSRIDQATAIMAAVSNIAELRLPITRSGCRHVYYTIPFLLDRGRNRFVRSLLAQGVPVVGGYVPPLYRMPAFAKFARPCPVAEGLHDHRLFYIENTRWDFTLEQCERIGAAFRKAAKAVL